MHVLYDNNTYVGNDGRVSDSFNKHTYSYIQYQATGIKRTRRTSLKKKNAISSKTAHTVIIY